MWGRRWPFDSGSRSTRDVTSGRPSVFFELHRVTPLHFLGLSPARDATFGHRRCYFKLIDPFSLVIWYLRVYVVSLRWCKLVWLSSRRMDRCRGLFRMVLRGYGGLWFLAVECMKSLKNGCKIKVLATLRNWRFLALCCGLLPPQDGARRG